MAAPLGKRKWPCARRGGGAAYKGVGSAMEARDLRWETLEALRASSKGRLKYFRHSDRDEVRLLGPGRREPFSAVGLGGAARSRGSPLPFLFAKTRFSPGYLGGMHFSSDAVLLCRMGPG